MSGDSRALKAGKHVHVGRGGAEITAQAPATSFGEDLQFFWHVHDFAEDCVNQGGISKVLMI